MARVPVGDGETRPVTSRRWAKRGAVGAAGLIAAAGLAATGTGSAHAAVAPAPKPATTDAAGLTFTEQWYVQLPSSIAESSPVPATLDGVPAVVVGALNGKVYALGLAGGGAVKGWPATDPGGAPIQSTPSVSGSTVYVGTGDAAHPSPGGYLALNANGTKKWYRTIGRTPGSKKAPWGVQASLAVGTLQGTNAVVAGTLGQQELELRAATGATMPGFAWYQADTEFSTPAVTALYGNGRNYIVEGGDSTAGISYGIRYQNGGHIRVLQAAGNAGKQPPSHGLVCQFNTTQGVESSPAVGHFLKRGQEGIVVGTGTFYRGASDSDKLIAVGSHCGLAWEAKLDGSTLDSPALVDATGGNTLQVAEGTATSGGAGTVYLLNGATGRTLWTHQVTGEVIGGITSANLGAGHQDLLVPTTRGLFVLDGKTGQQVALLGGGGTIGLQSSALVTDDADGHIGITVAGYNSKGGKLIHWEVGGTTGSLADEVGAWPMFHHDAHLSGAAKGG